MVEGRRCPKCGGSEEDIVISIDETADCYACNWKGHEDDLVEREPIPEGDKDAVYCPQCHIRIMRHYQNTCSDCEVEK